MKFSIVIPLEFHRDLAERCVRAWAQEQTFLREDFELLLASPAKFDEAELTQLAQLLAPHDRLIRLPCDHDMPLAAQAAREAHGEVLVFTEAHCLPETNFLEQCSIVLAEQREWAGFSCRSIPTTHNLLSEIEAEMYDADIQRNMQQHPWLKVLDQCLVIRREAYLATGGIEPQYGHFAEWVFAARFYRKGYQIGYDERPAVHHYYIGDLHELEEFTLDFAAGQMRFAQSAGSDPCGDLFDEVPEWNQRQRWNPQAAACMKRLLAADRSQTQGRNRSPWQFAGLSLRGTVTRLRLQIIWLRTVVRWRLRAGNKRRARETFLRLIACWVQLGRLDYLLNLPDDYLAAECAQPAPGSEWLPGIRQTLPSAGLHQYELQDRIGFRWSEPAAMIWLPPLKGDWRITMEWTDGASFRHRQAARFYLNEQRVLPERIVHRENLTEFLVSSEGEQSLRLSWTGEEFAESKDARRLGLPLARVSWSQVDTQAKSQAEREALQAATNAAAAERYADAIYFLHVKKCAGTTTRLVLTNTFSARAMLNAYNVAFYYAWQLKNQPELQLPYAFATGHFGWELMAQVTNRSWHIVTILRDPLERLLSQFDYLSQHHRLSSEASFSGWVEHDLRADDLMLSFFVPGFILAPTRGVKPLSKALAHHLPTALANLRACEVVGLQERLDDSLNLICAATGSLPPRHVSRVNVTLRRTPRAELDPQAMNLLAKGLRVEREFYAAAQAIFEKQLAQLHKRLAEEEGRELDTQGVRDVLRHRYFARRSNEYAQQELPNEISWSPDDDFTGHNLHDREHHAGQTLRWTGPEAETFFYFPVKMGTRNTITIGLHSATPMDCVEGTQLFVNEAEVPLEWTMASEGYVLTGEFDSGPPPSDCGLLSEFRLVTPMQRGTNEFRHLGVALHSLHLKQHAAQAIGIGAGAD